MDNNWRLKSFTYWFNGVLAAVGIALLFTDKDEKGMILISMAGVNLGFREKTNKKIG